MTKYAHWAEKIDSYEKFEAAYSKGRPSYIHDLILSHPTGNSYRIDDYWFIAREMYREAAGIYPEPTTVLTSLRNSYAGLAQYFVHVSKDDPTMVAYTPDRTAGMADKQVRTTLGRFLRKYLLCPSDDWVAKQEAQHRADLNGEFLIARTVEEIEEVYTKMRGDSGCMRHSKASFNLAYHPSAVYTGPGLGVAYLRNSSGQVNARSVIYVNPDNPEDKRYVRLYGDAALASKLKRQGFRQAALEGAKLAMFKAGKGKEENAFIMPYLDGPGGNRGSGKDCEAEYVIWPKGEDYFVAVSSKTANLLSRANLPVYGARTTAGYIEANPTDLSAMNVTCHFTGKTLNLLVGDTADQVLLEDGSMVYASAKANLGEYDHYLSIYNSSTFARLACTEATYRKYSFNGGYYPDDKTVAYFGYRRLSEKFYPDLTISQRVVSKDSAATIVVDGVNHYVKSIDLYYKIDTAVAEYGFDHTKTRIFKTEVPALKKDGWISVAPIGTIKTIAHKTNPSIVKLTSGKTACRGLHEIVSLAEGGWAYLKNVKCLNILGASAYTLTTDFSVPVPVDQFAKWSFFQYDLSTPDSVEKLKQRLAVHIVRNGVTGCRAMVQSSPLAAISVANSYTTNTYENLMRAVNTLNGMTDDQLNSISFGHRAIRFYVRAMLALDRLVQDAITEAKYRSAEANAVDYSLTPEQVLEQAARDVRNHPKPAPEPVNGRVSADELLRWARTAGTGGVVGPSVVVRTTAQPIF